MKFLFLILSVFLSTSALAHEGEHNLPGIVQAPKGGDIKSFSDGYIEVLLKKKTLKIYLYDKKMKLQTRLSGYSVTAEAQLPRSKDIKSLNLKETKNSFNAEFDAGESHRFILDVGVIDHKTKHADRVSFNVEPRKP